MMCTGYADCRTRVFMAPCIFALTLIGIELSDQLTKIILVYYCDKSRSEPQHHCMACGMYGMC